MICHLSEFGDQPVRTQVAVIGSGPAGTEVASWLAARGRQVTVLESGREIFDPRVQALAEAEHVGRPHRAWSDDADFHENLPHDYRGLSRVRQLGGSSVVWAGKWRSFERRDVEGRHWVPGSRWPISYAELLASYEEVARDYQIAHEGWPGLAEDVAAFESAGLKALRYFKHATAYRTADRLRTAQCSGLGVVIDATVTRIDLDATGVRATALACRSLDGAERRIEAQHVVLAAGGLENARILLLSDHQHPSGLGNGRDLVGRFYQDHLKINRALLFPGLLLDGHAGAVQADPLPRAALCFGLPHAEQERLGILDASIFLRPIYESLPARLRNRVTGTRMVRDGIGFVRCYRAKFAMEQAVNRDSRVRLSADRDAMGLRRLAIDWRLTELDRRSFEIGTHEFARLARRSGLGRIDYGADPADWDAATDAAHHIGTTRMANAPSQGVVDPNCAVFGIPNLHIAGSSVFPTGAAYAPTYTIVALARRLARRIDGLMAPVEMTALRPAS